MNKDHVDIISLAVSSIFTAVQPDEVLKWVSLGITILSAVVSLAFRIWIWWKRANEDKKLTVGEIEDLVDIIADGVDDIKKATKEDDTETKDESEVNTHGKRKR